MSSERDDIDWLISAIENSACRCDPSTTNALLETIETHLKQMKVMMHYICKNIKIEEDAP